jgi:hypothetical protein
MYNNLTINEALINSEPFISNCWVYKLSIPVPFLINILKSQICDDKQTKVKKVCLLFTDVIRAHPKECKRSMHFCGLLKGKLVRIKYHILPTVVLNKELAPEYHHYNNHDEQE